MEKANGTGSRRSTRVRRIKRVIIGFALALILLPTVLCGFLFYRVGKIEEAVAELTLKKETTSIVTDNTLLKQPNASEPNITSKYKVVNDGVSVSDAVDSDKQGKAVDKADGKSGGKVSSEAFDEQELTIDIDAILSMGSADQDVAEDENAEFVTKKVYLTFDDGPSSNTHRILDILDEYGVKATFFVVGRLNENTAPLYRRIVSDGHTIGMHSYSHKYNEIYASEDAFNYDIDRIQALIYEETGVLPHFYRFPGGSSNTVSKVSTEKLQQILSNRGIIYYDWNVSSGDATATYGLSEDAIVKNCINGAKGKEEVMILMHDLPEKFTTTEALPQIIEYFQKNGAEILPIDETSSQFLHEDVQ